MNDRSLTVHAPAPRPPGLDPRRWWALVLLALAQFMVILDITVVNVALPSIGAGLHLDRASLTWVVTAYTLCFGGLMLLGGRLADTLGRRRTFLAGLGVFTVASLASGLAHAGPVLVAARAGQGVGAALLSPAALAIITTTFHGPERNRALGVWAAIAGAGAAVGVLAGGVLTEYASWRWVFFINLPIGGAVAALVPLMVAAVRPAHPARRLDLPGALTATLATGAVIYGLVTAGSDGWGATTTTLLPLAAGLALAGVFLAVERTAPEPLVPLQILTRRPLVAGQLVMLSASGLLIASFFLSSLYLQRLLGYTALGTGLVFLPVALAIIVGSHLGARVVGHLGPRPVAAVGFGLVAGGAAAVAPACRRPGAGRPAPGLPAGRRWAGRELGHRRHHRHGPRRPGCGRADLGAAQHRPRARRLPGGGVRLRDRQRQRHHRVPGWTAASRRVRPRVPGLRGGSRRGRRGRPMAAAPGRPPATDGPIFAH